MNCTIFDCTPNSNGWSDLLTERYIELVGDQTACATIETNFCACEKLVEFNKYYSYCSCQ